MNTWGEFAAAAPELATFGSQRFASGVAYLATVKADGAPRVHPVTPHIGQGHLFIFMEPTSPKGHDLRRDGRYALHCAVTNSSGESGEFWCSGCGTLIEDPAVRAIAVQSSPYSPKDHYILFELAVESAASTVYEDEQPVRTRWRAS